MSDNNNFSVVDVPEPIAEAIADTFNDLSTPARKDIGNFLGDISYCVFGKLHTHISKRRISDSLAVEFHEATERTKHDLNLKKYLTSISDVIESTPDDKLCEPRLDIVGPAIEASKYYINTEEIRAMFVNLIGSSINIDTSKQVHHSFVEIIKQLSPLDAHILQEFKNNNRRALAHYQIQHTTGGFTPIYSNVVLFNCSLDIVANSISVTNLDRLGVLRIEMITDLTDPRNYDVFKSESNYQKCLNIINQIKNGARPDYFKDELPISYRALADAIGLRLAQHYVEVTPLGKSFIDCCL